MNTLEELKEMEQMVGEVAGVARAFGLDYGDVHFELCSPPVLQALAAYGLPRRFSHWSFGRAYHRLRAYHAFQTQRIYELVLNTRPVRAYVLAGVPAAHKLMIIAHSLAHSDFFRRNVHFAGLPEKMAERAAAHAEKLRVFEERYGGDAVETLLDAVLALEEQVAPAGQECAAVAAGAERGAAPAIGGDLLAFLAAASPVLAAWQREVIGMVREEALFFRAQRVTKITNEGWATYWHTRLMRALDLDTGRLVDWARLQAQLLQRDPLGVNPYGLGLAIFEAVADGRVPVYPPEGDGPESRLFWVGKTEDDVSLCRNYLTPELVAALDLYVYRRVGEQWVVTAPATAWETVRDVLVRRLTDAGSPRLAVLDANYRDRGELYLRHLYDGRELEVSGLEKVLRCLYFLWGRPVHLETLRGGETAVLSYGVQGPSLRLVGAS